MSTLEVQEPFGDWLRRRRLELGLSQRRLAAKAGVSHVTIGNWERGEESPNKENRGGLAAALEVSQVEVWDRLRDHFLSNPDGDAGSSHDNNGWRERLSDRPLPFRSSVVSMAA